MALPRGVCTCQYLLVAVSLARVARGNTLLGHYLVVAESFARVVPQKFEALHEAAGDKEEVRGEEADAHYYCAVGPVVDEEGHDDANAHS